MRVTILGCGGSGGVPQIGGDWGDCDPANPRNRRLRASILVQEANTTLVVDTTPDLRRQLLAAGVTRLDAVLYTHAHADHLHGIDDLRQMKRLTGRPIPIHADAGTLTEIRQRFGYAVEGMEGESDFYGPLVEPHIIDGPFSVGDIDIRPFEQDHGFPGATLGFRFGQLAYSTDLVELPEAAFEALDGIGLWIVDCLREAPHPTHAHLEKTLGWIERLRPGRAVLTHMNTSLDYDRLAAKCPPGVEPAYDGLVIEV
ncbi:MAG: MBL fold metallo-hydrolase [Kiloniellales bacterium]